MTSFTTRVELHGATGDHYTRLHEAMERAGFRRWIVGRNSSRYALPTAEYDFSGTYTASQVRDLAKGIADNVKLGAWVLVTEAGERAWTTQALTPA